jgi:hypothetical protein
MEVVVVEAVAQGDYPEACCEGWTLRKTVYEREFEYTVKK